MRRAHFILVAAAALAGCGSGNPPTGTVEIAVSAKPQRTVTLTGISGLLTTVLTDLYLQFDQTDDSTHGGQLVSRGPSCVAATPAEIASCRAECPDLGDPNLIKACTVRCSNLQDCTDNVCAPRFTYDYAQFGSVFKAAFTKPCNAPDDSCPSCTVGGRASVVEDTDLTNYVPDPIYSTTILGNPMSCRLSTFGIDLRTSNPSFNFNDWVTLDSAANPGDPYHVQVKAFASDPTVRCTIGISPTLRSPTFDFYLKPAVVNHHPSLGVVANFTSHVDYALDWAYSLDDKVNGTVTRTVNGVLGRNQAKIDQQLELLLLKQIQQQNGDQVDDFLDVHFDGDGLVVVYTPSCVDGVCSCTPDCSGGRNCGTDLHCGVSCGTCQYGACDTRSGICQCTPRTCDGACGHIADGCGGTLICPACHCTPSCTGKKCGAGDGCGGSCYGYCPARRVCQDDGDGLKLCVYAGLNP